MTAHVPILIVAVPLLGAALAALAGFVSTALVRTVGLLALGLSVVLSAWGLGQALSAGTIRYMLGGWPAPWGIEYVLDPLSGGVAFLIAAFAFLTSIYAGPVLSRLGPQDSGVFHGVYLLLVAGLAGIVLTGDLFNLYVFLEISSLAAYALLALGEDRSAVASYRYLLIGTVAGSLYLLGVGYLYALTGTLNMADLAQRLPALADSPATMVAVVLMAVGLTIKMGLFPVHGWLPDVYTYAPAAVTGFIAAIMAKVSAYALLRILLYVMPPAALVGDTQALFGWFAAGAILAGSVLALVQTDVRRMLAYSSVGQMGYIVLGFALGTPLALAGALLHLLNHAVMKGCLFLAAGAVTFRLGATTVEGYSGAARPLPLTMAAFVLAAASLVGLPPTAGFFSKWYLLLASLESGAWVFALVLIVSSLLSAVYLFRVIERAYLGEQPEHAPAASGRRMELPAGMLGPIVLLGAAVLLLGFANQSIVAHVITLALPPSGTP